MKTIIQKIDENNKIIASYNNIMAAAKDIDNKKATWQNAITIAYAMKNHKKAFKAKWKQVKK